jgi:phosphoribosylanthranilate isomerase
LKLGTRVKVCGITRLEDGLAAAECGVDAIGFNFWPSSTRYLGLAESISISAELPKSLKRVGLFVNSASENVERILADVDLDFLQFHGGELPSMCRSFGVPYIKAISAISASEIEREAEGFHDAAAILLDTPATGQFGGLGERFDWSIVPRLRLPLILAGGLTPINVAEAINQVHPCAVDVASGVESSEGIKDSVLMRQFMAAVKQVDRSER